MSVYSQYNLVLGILLVVTGSLLLKSKPHFVAVLKTSLLLGLLSHPFNYLCIQLSAWDHTDPGPLLFGVPINDLIFIFYISFFASALFSRQNFK